MKLDAAQLAALYRIQARLEAHLELLQNTDAPAVILIEEELLVLGDVLGEADVGATDESES